MNYEETGLLLGKIAAVDNRKVDAVTIAAWQELLAPVSYRNALEALKSHRTTRPGVWIEPGHIIAGAKAIRDANLRRLTPEPPAGEPLSIDMYRAWLKAANRLLGDGLEPDEIVAQACAEIGIDPPAQISEGRDPRKLIDKTAAATTPGRPSRRPSSSQEEM